MICRSRSGARVARSAIAAGAALVLTAGLVGASSAPVTAAGASDPTAPVPAALESTAWAQHGPKLGGSYAARSQVALAPGGTAIWGVLITAGTNSVDAGARLVFDALPPGVSVAPAKLPSSVKTEEVGSASNCSTQSGSVFCGLSSAIPSGSTRAVAVALTDTSGADSNVVFEGRVALVNSSNAQLAETPLAVQVKAGTKDSMYVYADAERLVREGTRLRRVMHVYNLGGGSERPRAKSRVRLLNVLPGRVAKGAAASGRGWSCGRGDGIKSCRWRGRGFVAGAGTSPLTIRHVIPKGAHRGLKLRGGSRGLTWVTKVRPDRWIAAEQHTQVINLLPRQPKKTDPRKRRRHLVRVGDLSLSGSEMSQPRLGGSGRYLVMINNGGGKPVRKAHVRLRVPQHAKVISAESQGWRCDRSGDCVNKAVIAPKQGAESIEFTIASKTGKRSSTRGTVAAVATWKGRGKDRRDRLVLTRHWHPSLRVKASAQSRGMRTDVPGLKGMLTGKVEGLNGEKFGYSWRQICPKGEAGRKGKERCPRVIWDGPVSGTTDHPVVTAAFTPPKVTRDTKLRFLLDVGEGGAEVRKRVTVVAEAPVRKTRPSGAAGKRRKPKFPPRLNRNKPMGARLKPAATITIGGRGPTAAIAGSRTKIVAKVRLRGKHNRLWKINWRVGDGQLAAFPGGLRTKNRGRKLIVRVPNKLSEPILLTAVARHGSKRSTIASEIVTVNDTIDRSTSLPVGSGSDHKVSAAAGAYCDLFNAAQGGTLTSLTFDSIEMSIGQAVASGANCGLDTSSIAVTNASLTINGVGLTGVVGSITPTGMAITSGFLNLPGAPAQQGMTIFTFNGSPALNVPFTGGTLTGLSGNVTLSGLPYLPPPPGWSLKSASMTFGPVSGGYQVSVTATVMAAPPEQGTVVVSGTIGAGGAANLTVTAANLMPIVSVDGSSTVFSGTGTVTRQPGQEVVYNVNIAVVPPPGGAFEIYGRVTMTQAYLTWTNAGLTLNGTGAVAMNNSSYSFTVAGTITDMNDWSLTLASNDTVIAMEWLTLDRPSGTISSSRDPKTGATTLSMDLVLGVQFDPSDQGDNLQVTSATGHLGIFCPPGTTSESCADHVLQLQVDLTGSLHWMGGKTIPLNTTVDADINTGQFSVSIGIDGLDPANLESSGINFQSATAFYSDEPATDPALAGNPCMTTTQLATAEAVQGIVGTFQIADTGWTGSAMAISQAGGADSGGSFGMCLYGTFGGPGSNAQAAMPDGTGSFLAGGIVFTQFGTTMEIPGAGSVQLAGYDLLAWGEYHLPDSLTGMFGANAITAMYKKTIGESGQFSWQLTADVGFQNAFIFGGPTSTSSLSVAQAGITIARGTGSEKVPGALTFGVNLQLNLVTSGMTTNGGQVGYTGSGTQIAPDQVSMPLTGSISYAFTGANAGTWSLNAALGNSQSTLNDAFGISGLDINEIVIGAQLGPNPINNWVGFAASVTTPTDSSTIIGRFTSLLGIQPGTSMSFALQASETSPCFALSIGDPKGTTLAINAFDGMLQADYFEIFIAPEGCAIANNVPNMPSFGYAIDFVGSVLGVGATIHGLYSVASDGADVILDVDIEAFNLAGLDVTSDPGVVCEGASVKLENGSTWQNLPNQDKGPCLNLDVDLLKTSADLGFSGAVNLWGVLEVGVEGGMAVDLGSANPSRQLNMTGNANLDLFGIFTESASMTYVADYDLWTSSSGSDWAPKFTSFDIGASVPMDYYFINEQVTLGFDYANGFVSLVYVSFNTTSYLAIVEAGVKVTLAYCNPVKGSTCTVAGLPGGQGSVTQQGTNGAVEITVTGTVGYWLFGWQSTSATLLDVNIPVTFANPVHTPPAPVNYGAPAPPISDWPNPTWTYQPEMFMGINWAPTDLVKAAGLDPSYATNGQLQYGAAVNDASLPAPSARFDQSNLQITNATPGSDGTNTTVQVVVQLPETPTYKQVAGLNLPPVRLKNALLSFGKCSGSQTEAFSVSIPKWNQGHPLSTSSAALIISEVNWRIYLASVIETTSIAGQTAPADILANYQCGFGMITGATPSNPEGTGSTDTWATFPSLQTWLGTNSLGMRFNMGYPQQPPTDITQFCAPGQVPADAYGAQCQVNITTGLNNAWGTGWGASSTDGPPSG